MEYNNDFKYDLKLGQIHEQWLGTLFTDSTIEVKRDYMADRTGNVFIEFESRGKASGIASSLAEYWAFVLTDHRVVIVPTDVLKDLAREKYRKSGFVKGGDSNTSRGVLIKIGDLVR
jgi:hypothetical protein